MSIARTSQPICKGCGQTINGYYLTALGATWHPEHFVCALCHQPIDDTQFNIHEGKPYHPECYHDHMDPRCAYCHKSITGQYFTHNGATYHPECYQEHIVSRCEYCHKPIMGQYYTHESASYHTACYRDHVAPRCAYCGKPLMSEYVVDHWGTKYCKEHQSQYPKCAYCGRLVPPQQQEQAAQSSERVRCPFCRASAIESLPQARILFQGLLPQLNAQGLQYDNVPLQLELVDQARLAQLLHGRSGADALGVTMQSTHMLNKQIVRTEVNGIAVLRGLPSTLFLGVCVHELGHAWLTLQGIQGLASWAEEGFCELLSYRFYGKLNTDESRHHAEGIEKNPDPVYGEGFRRVRAMADRMGFQRFVETLRTTKRMPSA